MIKSKRQIKKEIISKIKRIRETIKENIYWNGKGDPEPTLEDLLFNLGK